LQIHLYIGRKTVCDSGLAGIALGPKVKDICLHMVDEFGTKLDSLKFRLMHSKIMCPLFENSSVVELFPPNLCLAEKDGVVGAG